MNLFDLLVVVAAVAAAFGGYRLGFLTRGLSWVGMGIGIFLAAKLVPEILELFRSQQPEVRLTVAAIVFLGIVSLGAALGETVGVRIRRTLPHGPAREIDHAVGAIAGVLGTFILLWLFLPAIKDMSGEVSKQVRESKIAQALDDVTPRAPAALQDLRQLITDAEFPEVFSDLRPAPSTDDPPGEVALSEAVQRRVIASTVKVSGEACRRVQEGSGFAAAPELIATNAHVVAGVDRPTVLRPDGERLRAQVVAFDPNRDLALLRVPGLDQDALPVGSADVGMSGAVFGHPRGQVAIEASPARIEDRINARGRDLYGRSSVQREIFVLASDLEPGDSGAALVDPDGTVVGVAFAIAPDRSATAYALTNEELEAVLADRGNQAVDTGPCIS